MKRKKHIEYKILIEMFQKLRIDGLLEDSVFLKDEDATWALLEDMTRRLGRSPDYNIWTPDRIEIFYSDFIDYMIRVFAEVDKSHESSN